MAKPSFSLLGLNLQHAMLKDTILYSLANHIFDFGIGLIPETMMDGPNKWTKNTSPLISLYTAIEYDLSTAQLCNTITNHMFFNTML